ncbi:MAG: hypothetical protein HY298_20215 [Verrucomicrobia bacterium]|nr:hypothetical protein [Verrucomicrobiota bacterium]
MSGRSRKSVSVKPPCLDLVDTVGVTHETWMAMECLKPFCPKATPAVMEGAKFGASPAGGIRSLVQHGIEQMMVTGNPSWNVERSLLTSGTLDTLLLSLNKNQRRIETPYLRLRYQPTWRWTEPPPPPPMGPWSEQ